MASRRPLLYVRLEEVLGEKRPVWHQRTLRVLKDKPHALSVPGSVKRHRCARLQVLPPKAPNEVVVSLASFNFRMVKATAALLGFSAPAIRPDRR